MSGREEGITPLSLYFGTDLGRGEEVTQGSWRQNTWEGERKKEEGTQAEGRNENKIVTGQKPTVTQGPRKKMEG